jgi:hypothetical protein
MPFVSKQKGKMSALLKQKSKVGVLSKTRTQYEAYDFVKKKRLADGTVEEIKQGGDTSMADEGKIQPRPKRGAKS